MMWRPGPLRCGYPRWWGCGRMRPCPKHPRPWDKHEEILRQLVTLNPDLPRRRHG